jgi:hypothetical protein
MSGVTRIRVGQSTHADAATAAREAARSAIEHAGAPAVALVFCTHQYAGDTFASAMNEALGGVDWGGCSAVGVFSGAEMLDRGVVVAVIDSATTKARVGVAHGVARSPRKAGATAVARALDGMAVTPSGRRRLIIVLPDTSRGSAVEVVRGALGEGGNGVVWAGGGAGDTSSALALTQFAGGTAHADSVVAIAVDLPSAAGTGVRHGWRPFGAPALVTRAEGNVALELEYRSAFDVYRETAATVGASLDAETFGDFAMLHPLGIPQANEQYLIRDPLAVTDGGLQCVAEIPDGALVRMMRAQREDIVSAGGLAASEAGQAVDGPISGALVFDCMSRQLVLGASFDRELAAFQRALGPDVPVFGCLTFGEIAAFEREVPQFHNKTTVMVAFPR